MSSDHAESKEQQDTGPDQSNTLIAASMSRPADSESPPTPSLPPAIPPSPTPAPPPSSSPPAVPPPPAALPLMVPSEPPSAPDERKGKASASATIAKWLIPSVAALFGVVGYVVQVAHESLLGVAVDRGDTGRYVANAAEFFRDIAALFFGDFLISVVSLYSARGAVLAVGAILIVVVGIWVWRTKAGGASAWVLSFVLLALVAYKFFEMDVPISKVENMVVRTGQAPAKSDNGSEPGILRIPELRGASSQLATRVALRTNALWTHVVCSRVGPNAAAQKIVDSQKPICKSNQSDDRKELQDEFFAHLFVGLLVCVGAVVLLGSMRGMHIGIGILSLVYLLTVPYAYGKLMKSTLFDYGRVWPAKTLTDASGAPAPHYLYALILSRNAVSTNLLIVQRGDCVNDPQMGEGRKAQYATVKMSSLSASQVLSIEEIYRDDAIAWAILNEQGCPTPVPSPYRPDQRIE